MVEPSPSSEKPNALRGDRQPTAEQWLSQTVRRAREVVVDEPTERRAELVLPALEVIAARGRKRAKPVFAASSGLLPAPGRLFAFAAVCGILFVVGTQFGVFESEEGWLATARVNMEVTPAEHAIAAAVELPGLRIELSGDTPVEVVKDEQSASAEAGTMRRASKRSVAPASLSAALAKSVSGTAVTLAQGVGQATYRVDPAALRKVRVVAGGATISVKGTQFLVDVDSERVRVRVYRGVVEVQHQGRQQTMRADEEVVLAVSAGSDGQDPPQETASADQMPGSLDGRTSLKRPGRKAVRPETQQLSPLQALVGRADAARSSGRHSESVKLLQKLLREYPREGRVASWHFTLGRAYRALGQSKSAAQAFGASRRTAPSGVLAHDALAEEARAWASAGEENKASSLAKQYLARYPKGNFAIKMRSLLR